MPLLLEEGSLVPGLNQQPAGVCGAWAAVGQGGEQGRCPRSEHGACAAGSGAFRDCSLGLVCCKVDTSKQTQFETRH